MKKIFLFSVIAMALQITGCSSAPVLVPSTHWEQQSTSESKATAPVDPNPPEPAKEQTSFCSYNGGLEFGRQGGVYTGQCPKTLERAFKKGYLKGRAEYDKQHPQEGNK